MTKTFDEWHRVNAKYMEAVDIVPWCEAAWDAASAIKDARIAELERANELYQSKHTIDQAELATANERIKELEDRLKDYAAGDVLHDPNWSNNNDV